MGKNVILTAILVFLFIANVSDASFSRNFRKLVASPPTEDSNSSDSPNLSPNSTGNQTTPVGGEEKGTKKQNQPPPASPPGDVNSKDKQVTNDASKSPSSPPPTTDAEEHKSNSSTHKENVKEKGKETEKGNEKDNEKSEEKEEEKEEQKEKKDEKAEEKEEEKEEQKEKEKEQVKQKEKDKEKEGTEGSKAGTPVGSDESCDGKGRCNDLKSMTACIKSFDHDSKVLVLLIQNKGDNSLKVDLTMSSPSKKHEVIDIPKLQNKQVDMSLAESGINEVTLDAGNGHCVLHLGAPASQGNFFKQMPSYSKFMTPVYGAYLMLVLTLIAGGVFACCCWFRKRKGQRENAYQELEMSMPESAVAVETADWDEVWDDDWDEENAVRSPGGHGISANGLTSRNTKKGDWEDWDD